jgi:hypothetical protein
MGLGCLDRLPLQPVVPQQGLIPLVERGPGCPWRHGGRQAVGAVQQRHAAQFPQGVLQPLAEALVALGEADGAGLPVRVGQHEVVDEVVERHAGYGHVQVGAVREVTGRQPAGVMHLSEEDLLRRSVLGPPLPDVPLQRAELAVGEAAGEAALQVGEQGLGLQAGVEAEQLFEARPDVGERVGPGTPVAVHASDLRGQLAEAAVRAGGLGVEAGLGGGQFLGQPFAVEAEELADLLIGDHREPPVRGSRWCTAARRPGILIVAEGADWSDQIGNSSCRRPGTIVVVHQLKTQK